MALRRRADGQGRVSQRRLQGTDAPWLGCCDLQALSLSVQLGMPGRCSSVPEAAQRQRRSARLCTRNQAHSGLPAEQSRNGKWGSREAPSSEPPTPNNSTCPTALLLNIHTPHPPFNFSCLFAVRGSLNFCSGFFSTQHKPLQLPRKTLCLSGCFSPQQPTDAPEGTKWHINQAWTDPCPPLKTCPVFPKPTVQLLSTSLGIHSITTWQEFLPPLNRFAQFPDPQHLDLWLPYSFRCQRISEKLLYARH